MSISLNRYVNITSGIGAATTVPTRDLIARLFSTNPLIPTGTFVEFTSADQVADYFGDDSVEYARALFYFDWVSKSITRPQKISFGRWNSAASAPQIFGAKGTQAVASWTSISNGSLALTIAGSAYAILGMNFGAAVSLSGVAAIVQAAIRAAGVPATFTGVVATSLGVDTLTASSVTGTIQIGQTITGTGVAANTTIAAYGTGTGGAGTYILSSSGQTVSSTAMVAGSTNTNLTLATVVWNSARQSFDFTGGATGAATISVGAGTAGTNIAGQIGWLSATAIISDGAAIQSITAVLTDSADDSTNFGSFTFIPTLTEDQIVEAAEWNDARNIQFMYSVRCTEDNAVALSAALEDIGGVTLTLAPLSDEYPEMAPMMILASTDYIARNSSQNYMFQIFELTPSVTTDADANTYDALKINYYGQTQTAGQQLSFYQRGVMFGLDVDPADQNVYANEMWLKDTAAAAIMTLLLSLTKISANAKGRAQILSILQGVINLAIFNGTISVGKTLSDVQKLYITEQTGDPTAWQQVQNSGYWVTVAIVPYVEESVTKYKAVYTLIYSKDDVIRLVEGRDILI